MVGVIFSIIAGIFISLQGVFNSKLTEKIGIWETNTIVHGTGLIIAFIMLLVAGNGSFKKINEVDNIYLLGGAFGVIIVFSVIKGISTLGPTYSIAILLVTQLIAATIIDCLGLFGISPIEFHFTKPLGILIMIIGIIIFKLKG